MSTRGMKFLDKWVAKQLPTVARGDPIATSDEKAGIPPTTSTVRSKASSKRS
ncbi:DUF768 domain-containing protein [Mesorhizobium sp. LSHC412B00]|uniref:DUF768 domain-containing protein n=1 Tax=Mesorhizobium sp. LSHC412B00 TaxID=1287285 RepID=UPI0003CF6F3E|nr:DUF768 domain-containing protein [Mesorhizobium sp. LSHC412B00]ESX81603.1 hypothetical protein X756_31925 [Mesorhizobium sp. LSHC412B00]